MAVRKKKESEENTTENKNENSREDVSTDSGEDLKFAGYFRAASRQNSDPPDVPLEKVPSYYKVINVDPAILVKYALIEYDYNPLNINIPMVTAAQDLRNVKVLLSVGGKNGQFNLLNSNANVTNFYNALKDLYRMWGFDGVTFDIRQLDDTNRPFVIKAIRKFKKYFQEEEFFQPEEEEGEEERPGALPPKDPLISITALPTYVCPAAEGIYDIYNQLVPVINGLKGIIDLIQVMAYDYGSDYNEFITSPPISHPPPVGDPKGMLEYIFSSYVETFEFSKPIEMDDKKINGYKGIDSDRVILGVLASGDTGMKNFVLADEVNEVIQTLRKKYVKGIGGVMISNINYDNKNEYKFSKEIDLALR